MILLRLPAKYRAWWDTKLCRDYGCGGWAAALWARHLAPVPHFAPDNDRDHIRW